MMHLLAQAEPLPAALAQWLQVLLYLAGFIGTLLGIAVAIKLLRSKEAGVPQPLEVKAHATIANQADIDQLHGRLKRERAELDAEIKSLKAEDLRLREKLDSEIEALQDKIEAVPERTIALLKNTKGLL